MGGAHEQPAATTIHRDHGRDRAREPAREPAGEARLVVARRLHRLQVVRSFSGDDTQDGGGLPRAKLDDSDGARADATLRPPHRAGAPAGMHPLRLAQRARAPAREGLAVVATVEANPSERPACHPPAAAHAGRTRVQALQLQGGVVDAGARIARARERAQHAHRDAVAAPHRADHRVDRAGMVAREGDARQRPAARAGDEEEMLPRMIGQDQNMTHGLTR